MWFRKSKKEKKNVTRIIVPKNLPQGCFGPDGKLPSLVTVTVVGDPKVGKTSLIKRFQEAKFTWNSQPTTGVDKTQLAVDRPQIMSSKVYFNFLDTNEFFFHGTRKMLPGRKAALHASYARYILVVYDISDHRTFDNSREWVTHLNNMELTDVTLILVGNKTDREKHRQVHKSAGQVFAMLKSTLFVETSARTCYNIRSLFNYLTRV